MIFVPFYLECLSHASYLVGDRTSGRAVVVDPQRDVNHYLATAERHGLTIERVIETHVHADFLSGHLELAARTGARVSYGARTDVAFDTDPLDHGRHLTLGEVDLEILHTPGHTPESICVVVREHARDTVPYAVLTGDTLFVGDVGRPDLLASQGRSADEMARALYRSTRALLALPDATRVHPAHGAGSSCGRNLSTELSSTIGEQRLSNYALADITEDQFVSAVLDAQPTAPAYFAYTSVRNRQTRPLLDEDAPVPALAPDAFRQAARAGGTTVLDTRDPEPFASAHLPGAINIPLGARFAELAGTVLDARDAILLCGDPSTARQARNRLARIGFDNVRGALATPVTALDAAHLTATERLTPRALAAAPDGGTLLDVRGTGEVHDNGTIPGSHHIPLPQLLARLDELPADRPLTVFCAGGNRSSVAASVLRARGFTATDLRGGFSAWHGEPSHPAATGPRA
ncbi:MBL fold metallo-hydrolase [Actinomadura logoneensis]|uniref:MBL fold metallo-hydrolase n=1 Tax=Actinomadura logoneensis TaxID=2293572 RepID=A0A372JI90_9ACTN|nr:MBL fold metallo-hydrolase [Actinomadura logoneensis]